jgi:hypothetical protein
MTSRAKIATRDIDLEDAIGGLQNFSILLKKNKRRYFLISDHYVCSNNNQEENSVTFY